MVTGCIIPLGLLLLLFAASALAVGRRDGLRCLAMLVAAPVVLLVMGWAVTVRGGALPTVLVVLLTALLVLAFQVSLLLGQKNSEPMNKEQKNSELLTSDILVRYSGFKIPWPALLGAGGGCLAAVLFALLAIRVLRITGIYSATMRDLWFASGTSNMKFHWLALGGIALVGVGVIADLAVGVAATIRQVHQANPALSARELFRAGMNFGRDVISTEVNTLPLAILGVALGGFLLLLARPDVARWPYSWMLLANDQATAVEAAALLAGTLGLVLTIPLTATLTAWALSPDSNRSQNPKSKSQNLKSLAWLLPLALLGVVVIAIFVRVGRTSHQYPAGKHGTRTQLVRGTVVEAEPELNPWAPRRRGAGAESLQRLTVKLGDGRRIQVENPVTGSPVNDKIPLIGDRVIVREQTTETESYAVLSRFERDRALLLFLLAACVAVVLVARWQGWRALIALAVSAMLIWLLLVALMRWRVPPIPATLVCILAITAVAYLIICGWRVKALGAAGGTLAGLGASALAALVFGHWLNLSGRYNSYLLEWGFILPGGDWTFAPC